MPEPNRSFILDFTGVIKGFDGLSLKFIVPANFVESQSQNSVPFRLYSIGTSRWDQKLYSEKYCRLYMSLRTNFFTYCYNLMESKEQKITGRSTSATTWNNGLWTQKSKKKVTDTIDSRGFSHIVWKAKFQHKIGMPIIKTVPNGAWFYGDGGCDWN